MSKRFEFVPEDTINEYRTGTNANGSCDTGFNGNAKIYGEATIY